MVMNIVDSSSIRYPLMEIVQDTAEREHFEYDADKCERVCDLLADICEHVINMELFNF